MALVQQVSCATAVAPKLHPFRDFLKETVPWLWSKDINKVLRDTKVKLANSLEEGIMSLGKQGVAEAWFPSTMPARSVCPGISGLCKSRAS